MPAGSWSFVFEFVPIREIVSTLLHHSGAGLSLETRKIIHDKTVNFLSNPLQPSAVDTNNDIDYAKLANDPVYQSADKEVSSFGFHQREKIGDLFPLVYSMMQSPKYRRHHHYLKVVWGWFLVSSTLWPGEFIPICRYLVQLLQKGLPLPPALILILRFAKDHPILSTRAMGKKRQNKAHKGEYDDLLKDDGIYLVRNAAVLENPEVGKSFEMMKAVFDMKSYANDIGVVRRYVVSERGFRVGWDFDPNIPETMMRTALTLLSYRYDLYGFQDDTPLVGKFTANPTGFGTIMMAPKYQTTDLARDLNRKTFGEFPKGYGVARQGAKALLAKRERENEAIRTYTASLRADERGEKGENRRRFIIEEARLPKRTERRKIQKLIKMGKELLGVK